MLGRDAKMHPGFVDPPKFAQGVGFAGREAIYEFSKIHQVGLHQGCDTGWLETRAKLTVSTRGAISNCSGKFFKGAV